MLKMKHRRSLAAALAALVLSLGLGMTPAHAVIINGSFESGDFTGFTTTGDTTIQTAAFGVTPTNGTFQALATTVDGPSVPAPALEAFFGLAPGSLNALAQPSNDPVATEGSGFLQSFTGMAGDIVSFDFNFLTREFTPDAGFNDFGFFVLNGTAFKLADTNSTFVPAAPGTPAGDTFPSQTGYQTFSTTLTTSGTQTIGFGVVDVSDTGGRSGLLVDNIQQQVVPAPEPSTWAMMIIGLAALAIATRRKKQPAYSRA